MTQDVSIPSTWRTTSSRYRLSGSKCLKCEKLFFPPRTICIKCKSPTSNEILFSGLGEVLAYTVITAAPSGFEKEVPYVVGIIELEEGPRVTAQIVDVDPDDIAEGMEVQLAFRRYAAPHSSKGVITYGYKFVPRFTH